MASPRVVPSPGAMGRTKALARADDEVATLHELQQKVNELEGEKAALLASLENMVGLYGLAKSSFEARASVAAETPLGAAASGKRLVDCDVEELAAMVLQLRESLKTAKEQTRVAVADKIVASKVFASEKEALTKEVAGLRHTLRDLQATSGAAAMDADESFVELTQERDMLLSYAQKLERRISELEAGGAGERAAELEQMLEKLRAEVAAAESEATAECERADTAEEELDALRAEFGFDEDADAEAIVAGLRERLATAAEFAEEQFSAATEAASARDAAEARVRALQEALAAAEGRSTARASAPTRDGEQVDALRRELQEMKRLRLCAAEGRDVALRDLEAERAEHNRTREAARTAEATANVALARADVATLRLREKLAAVQPADASGDAVTDELRRTRDEVVRLERRLVALERGRRDDRGELERARKQAQEANSELERVREASHKDIGALKEQLEFSEGRVQQLRDDLAVAVKAAKAARVAQAQASAQAAGEARGGAGGGPGTLRPSHSFYPSTPATKPEVRGRDASAVPFPLQAAAHDAALAALRGEGDANDAYKLRGLREAQVAAALDDSPTPPKR